MNTLLYMSSFILCVNKRHNYTSFGLHEKTVPIQILRLFPRSISLSRLTEMRGNVILRYIMSISNDNVIMLFL